MPSLHIVYGIEIDTTAIWLRLPEDKLAKATLLVNCMTKCCNMPSCDLLSLVGLFSYVCLVVPLGRAFLRRFINLTVDISATPLCYIILFQSGPVPGNQNVTADHLSP